MEENKEIMNGEPQEEVKESKAELEISKVVEGKNESKTEEVISQKSRKGYCIASLVLGIISLVFNCCLWYISIPCAILAIIFGILGLKSTDKGMAVAGLVTGSITVAIMVMIFGFAFMYGFVGGVMEGLENEDYFNSSYSDDF